MDREISYRLKYEHNTHLPEQNLIPLIAWRETLYRMQLIGKSAHKYDGMGYGTISQRANSVLLENFPTAFFVTGALSGQFKKITPQHFSFVRALDVQKNIVEAEGPCKPTSEAITHAALYQLDPTIEYVVHFHSPELWHKAGILGIVETDESIEYGTPALATAITELYNSGQLTECPMVSVRGHQDGLIAFGSNLDEVASLIIQKVTHAFSHADAPVDMLALRPSSALPFAG